MTERAKKLRQDADEATTQAMRRIHDSGELRHLYGLPLHLDDDPDWLVTRLLKQQGFSHPVIERSRELDEPRQAVDRLAERLRRRHRRALACRLENRATDASAFNAWRDTALAELREKLAALNRAIRDYNLQAPEALHQRLVPVDEALENIAREVPPVEIRTEAEGRDSRRTSVWKRLRSR